MYTIRRLDKPPRPLKAQALKELAEDNGWTVHEGWQQVGVHPKPDAPMLFIQTLRHPTEVRNVITIRWQRRQPTATIGWWGGGRIGASAKWKIPGRLTARALGLVQRTVLMEGKPPE